MPLADAVFNPRAIALIGASSDPARLTARAQIYLRRHGYTGALYPVNPRASTVLGEPAYASIADVPVEVDFAYILVGTPQVEATIAACAARGIPVACVLADGFAETGAEGAALQARIVDVAREGGMRLLGPNSMGVINIPAATACCVNATLDTDTLVAGGLSLVSQSGSVMGTLLSRAAARGFGFAKLVGTGNEADLTSSELVGLLADDPDTSTILLFLEAIRAPDVLAEAVRRALAAGKPVAAFMLGRSDAGAKLAATHTGALAGGAPASEAFLREIGVVRVDTLEALLEIAPLLRAGRPGAAPHRAVRVVTTTGGGGAMVVDRLGLAGIVTAHMHDTTLAGAGRDAVAALLTQARCAEDADLAIAVIGSSAQFKPQEAVAGVRAAQGPKPVCAFLAPEAPDSLRLLAAADIAAFRTPESCADAVRAYMDWQVPGTRPACGDLSAAGALLPFAADEPGARAVFAALGLRDHAIRIDPDALPALAYPVALKAVSSQITHKTEEGAVALNLPDAASLQTRAADMRQRLGGRITGFIAQQMVRGLAEAIIGFRRDPAVGPTIVLGAGGVLAEIYRDAVVRMAPVTEAEAMDMIRAVRGLAPVIGYRNLPRGDTAALAQAIAAISRLAGLEGVDDAEINPMIILPEGHGVVMADAVLIATIN